MNRPDAWNPLREFTDARIALGRSGASLPTREVLNFGLAHARARDAIHQPFASQQLVAPLAALGLDALTVHSAAPDRHMFIFPERRILMSIRIRNIRLLSRHLCYQFVL